MELLNNRQGWLRAVKMGALGAVLMGCPENPPRNPPLRVQIHFVSAAINGQSDGGAITVNAQMSWHAAINGQSDGGAITIRGVMY